MHSLENQTEKEMELAKFNAEAEHAQAMARDAASGYHFTTKRRDARPLA
jgi:hypothetical protein